MENGTFPVGVPSLSTLKVLQSLVETGNLQDIGTYFGLNAGVLQVASDVSEAPLPAALPLFASGLGFIGFLARRKKQRAVVG